jgi:hypothetical protein
VRASLPRHSGCHHSSGSGSVVKMITTITAAARVITTTVLQVDEGFEARVYWRLVLARYSKLTLIVVMLRL